MKEFSLFLIPIYLCCCIFCLFACKDNEKKDIVDYYPKYDISLKIDEENVDCSVSIDYTSNITSNFIILQCYSISYQKAVVDEEYIEETYPNGVNFGKTYIESISVDEKICEYMVNSENSSIIVYSPVEYGRNTRIKICYKLKLANLKHRLGYYNSFYSLCSFYPYVCPIVDGEYSVREYSKIGESELLHTSSFNVSVSISNNYVLIHTGEEINKTTENKIDTYHLQANNVRDFAIMYSKNVTMRSSTENGINFRYYYQKDSTPFDEIEIMKTATATFEKLFGEYGHKNLSLVLAPFPFGGMEYSEVVVVSDSLKEQSREEVIAHEIAHMWWFMKVGSDEYYSPWLDESLAEFSTALYYLDNGNGKMFELFRQRGLKELENRLIENKRLSIKGCVNDFTSDDYSACVYTLGSTMWITYYSIIGPTLTDRLKEYATLFENKIATEKDVEEIVFKNDSATLRAWLNGEVTAVGLSS